MTSTNRWLAGAGRRLIAVVGAIVIAAGGTLAIASPAEANTSTPNVPYSCTTNVGINQAASYSATITDSVDPAAIGQSVTYQFVVPFDQDPPPVTATYLGGTVTYPIPVGLNVTTVSTPPKAGSNLSATVKVQGSNIVVTTTGSQPIDGGSHPTPDLFVTGTVTAAAGGIGVVWKTPSQLVANVNAQIVGAVVATCTPDNPNAVIAQTTVPGTPLSPTATNQTVAVKYGASKAITLSATDPDTPAAQLTYSISNPPDHGVLTGTAPNLTYKPTAKYVGTDSFTFVVHDPQDGAGTGTVTLKDLPVIPIDNQPPAAAITSPANGAVFTTGQVVKAAYTCADATTAVETCTGTVANGASISTTTGAHVLTVDATDTLGNKGRQTVSYRVIDPAIVKQNFNATNVIPLTCDDIVPPLTPRTVPATASAPNQVGTGLNLTMRFAPGARSVGALMTATNVTFTLAVPVNGTAVSATKVAGTGTVAGTVAVTAGKVVLTLPGPIVGGNTSSTSYTPPAVDVTIKATTTPNVLVQTQLAQYKETDSISGVGQVPMTHTCTPTAPNPVLTKTSVLDTTPPTVSLTAPANGALVGVGAVVPTSFSCADTTALASCVGSTANGANVATSTPGVKTVAVTATDAAGNIAQKLVSFQVTQTSFTVHYATSEVPVLDAAAAYLHTDRPGVGRFAIGLIGLSLNANGPPVPAPAPIANNGPVTVTTTYSPAEGQVVAGAAQVYGMTGDQLIRYAAVLTLYIYSVQVH